MLGVGRWLHEGWAVAAREMVERAAEANESVRLTDPRVGSARDNSTTTNISRVGSGSNSSSGLSLIMALAPILIYFTICFLIFLTLRRRFPRIYAPRTFLNSLYPHERSVALPDGWFNWIKPFWDIPDSHVLNHSSLDGYLFLRFMKILVIICLVGCVITWPILLPIHAKGGNNLTELNLLTFGNVAHPSYYYAHVAVAWLFFGFVLYMVNRECIYFINLRQAYMLTPFYASRISSRTVLFTCVPRQYLSEYRLRALFDDTVKNVWIPKNTNDLDRVVKERDQTATRLERAEIDLIRKANEARNKALATGPSGILRGIKRGSSSDNDANGSVFNKLTRRKKSAPIEPASTPTELKEDQVNVTVGSPLSPDTTSTEFSEVPKWSPEFDYGSLPDVSGSVASQWIPHSDRPVHRPIANFGRSIDTIKWCRNRLKQMRVDLRKLRREYRMGISPPLPAVFIEFHTQVDAQAAYQTLAHHRPFHMNPVNVGLRPSEIIWPALGLTWWERIVRKFMIKGFITAMVIFWSIPCAIVGILTNIGFLADKVPFLHWINLLPPPILGLITGLVPAVALHLLMAAVPGLLRVCARVSGAPTVSLTELFCQNAYMVFLVVQVFLVTTLTSAASAAITQILDNPASARTLLAQSIPKASNFYVSFFLLQTLGVCGNRLAHMLSFWRLQVAHKNIQSPRILALRYQRLRRIHWGAIFPTYTNMGVIALTYTVIAPIVMGFAAAGLSLVYIVYKYNLIYVYDNEHDTRGLHYPRALKQLIVGLYLAEFTMIGLLSVGGGFGPAFLMILLFVLTILIHMSLSDALSPLLYNLPRTLAVRESSGPELSPIADPTRADIQFIYRTDLPDIQDMEDGVDPNYMHPSEQLAADAAQYGGPVNTRALEGAEEVTEIGTKVIGDLIKGKIRTNVTSHPKFKKFMDTIDFWSYWTSPDPYTKPNFVQKWLHPELFEDYSILKQMIPEDLPEATYPEDLARHAYDPPSMSEPEPRLWIPRDMAGVSRQEVVHSGKVVPISDEGATLNQKGGLEVDLSVFHPVLTARLPF